MPSLRKNLDLFAEEEITKKNNTSFKEKIQRSAKVSRNALFAASVSSDSVRLEIQHGSAPRAAVAKRQLWVALHFPQLPIEAVVRAEEIQNAFKKERSLKFQGSAAAHVAPLVVLEASGNQQRVFLANVTAMHAGVIPGLGLGAAHALVSSLATYARNVQLEQQLLELLATWAAKFTSFVSVQQPDSLLLEVKGSLRLFEGMERLLEKVTAEIKELNMPVKVAVAPTSLAALWFSRVGSAGLVVQSNAELKRHLAKLPVACLRWPASACKLLADIGVHTVGDCLRLPRDGFARRLGPELLTELDQALGTLPQPRRTFIARERYSGRHDFDMEVENSAGLEQMLQPLLDGMVEFLRKRQSATQVCKLLLQHRDRAPTKLIMRFVTPVSHKAHIGAVLSERLSRLELPEPVLAARLQSGALISLSSDSIHDRIFFENVNHDPAGIPRLIERLRARLGDDSVYGIKCVADYRPERAWGVHKDPVAPTRISPGPDTRNNCVPVPQSRPLWLLSQPELLDTEQGRPQYQGCCLQMESGPERIESGWWSGNDITRDYYKARTDAGVRLWIYRERLDSRRWFLHGRFG